MACAQSLVSLFKAQFMKIIIQAGAAAHQANPPPATPAHRVLVPVRAPDSVPVAPLPGQLSAVARECSGGWPKCLGPVTVWETRRRTWLLALDQRVHQPQGAGHGGHWRVSQWQRKTFLSVSLSLSTLPIRRKKKKTYLQGAGVFYIQFTVNQTVDRLIVGI